jgi:hypothetical protein
LFVGFALECADVSKRVKLRLSRFLPFAGLSIVAATFVVKETKRDEVKDFTESLNAANTVATSRMEELRLIADVRCPVGVAFELPNATLRSKLAEVITKNDIAIGDLLVTAHTALQVAEASSQQKELRDLNINISEISSARGAIQSAFDLSVLPDATDRQLTEAQRQMLKTNEQLSHLDVRISNAAFRVMIYSEGLAREKKREYELYKLWSYILYSVGWLISLVGKLMHVDTPLE